MNTLAPAPEEIRSVIKACSGAPFTTHLIADALGYRWIEDYEAPQLSNHERGAHPAIHDECFRMVDDGELEILRESYGCTPAMFRAVGLVRIGGAA